MKNVALHKKVTNFGRHHYCLDTDAVNFSVGRTARKLCRLYNLDLNDRIVQSCVLDLYPITFRMGLDIQYLNTANFVFG